MSTNIPTEIRAEQLDAIGVIERACSVFSLLGCLFIIVSFSCYKAFHKPINRLVFYASFGNMMANVGTLMSRSYVGMPSSAGCQFQAFLIQMFMPADAFWTLAMAVNVYLTFYYKFDSARLRKMEIPYMLCCYGIPFVPAIIYIFIDTEENGRFYGNATLWCWVTSSWDIFRIATFYGPIWLTIAATVFIYVRAGGEIYSKRQQLRNFSLPDPVPMPILKDPFSSLKTTEVVVTTEVAASETRVVPDKTPHDKPIDLGALGAAEPITTTATHTTKPNPVYSVTISTAPARRESLAEEGLAPPTPGARSTGNPLRRRAALEANNAAWSYTKCAILFFMAMLVTWVPSSANRVFSVVHSDKISVPLEYMSAFVLPLQGFWNAIIYIVTSWRACQIMWEDIVNWVDDKRGGRRSDVTELVGYEASVPGSQDGSGQNHHSRGDSGKSYESESMTELASSRPQSHEQKLQL